MRCLRLWHPLNVWITRCSWIHQTRLSTITLTIYPINRTFLATGTFWFGTKITVIASENKPVSLSLSFHWTLWDSSSEMLLWPLPLLLLLELLSWSWLELVISIPSLVSSKLFYKMMMLTINHGLKVPFPSIMFIYFYNSLTKNIG